MPIETNGRRHGRQAALLAALAAGVAAFAGPAWSAGGPFQGLEGVWGGNGVVTYSSGTKERLRCRVQYTLSNENSISQALRCASDSYNFQINAIYVHKDGAITGRWDEKYLEVSGTITGTASEGLISGNLHGPGFLAAVEVNTTGNMQTVTIAAEGQDIKEVAVEVKKATTN